MTSRGEEADTDEVLRIARGITERRADLMERLGRNDGAPTRRATGGMTIYDKQFVCLLGGIIISTVLSAASLLILGSSNTLLVMLIVNGDLALGILSGVVAHAWWLGLPQPWRVWR